jgi:MFS family permease
MATSAAPATGPRGTAYAWYVVVVLYLAYTFSYVDRTILTLMVKPIRASLQVTDTEISLLHGLAFAIFYSCLGVPIARLADRRNRTRLIMGGIAVWSVMTGLCGFARSFGQLRDRRGVLRNPHARLRCTQPALERRCRCRIPGDHAEPDARAGHGAVFLRP